MVKELRAMQVPILAIHHDPAVYAAPDEFRPERWMEGTPEYAADQHTPGSWMTFGVRPLAQLLCMETRMFLCKSSGTSSAMLLAPCMCSWPHVAA
jgi:hypothetical protein